MTRWMLQTAKNKFSQLIDCALREGPQLVTRRGADTAVVLSVEDFRALTRSANSDLVEFLRESPLAEVEPSLLVRTRDTGREIAF